MNSAHKPSPGRLLAHIILTLAAGSLAVSSAQAQGIRFQFQQTRVTVPVNSTTTMLVSNVPDTNNTVILNGVSIANFDVSGLPTGASAILTDTNGNPLTSTAQSTNLVIAINAVNVPEGTYLFSLNAGGTDTNGAPVTNSFPIVLQSAHIWNGGGLGTAGFGVTSSFTNAASWLGNNLPTSTSEVVFGDFGAQTNAAITNVTIDTSVTVSSIRFSQTAFTNDTVTNGLAYTIQLGTNATLAVTGTNGFSLQRDYIAEFGYSPDSSMTVNFINTNSGTLLVSNANANFGVLVGNGINPSLNFSNLATLVTYVDRMGLSDYQIYPHYRALSAGYNGDRDVNSYSGLPRQFWNSVLLARTNFITALYHNPDNYTNEFTRGYGITLQNNEQQGNGSSVNTLFLLGFTNVFNADSVCLIGASSASGNTGGVKFQRTGSGAVFRGTNGGRMSIFSVSDDGGTNQANSNVKSTIDFSGANNTVNIMADRFYIARDRTMIKSNQSPNVQGDFTMGAGTVDVNTAVLGFQEHSNKIDWVVGGGQAYLNYCEGRLVVTNSGTAVNLGGTFKVNGNLTLGYTADTNPSGSAQQNNTYGRITIYTNATVIASNIICDGGLNFRDSQGRQNSISINQGGTLIVSNTCGFPNDGGNFPDFAPDPRGLRLDNLTITGGKLMVNVDPSKTNFFVRTLLTPGLVPGIIKVTSLTGVTTFPAQIPVISYVGQAAPFLNADVTALGAGYFGYVLNNAANQTVDIYITTNAPNNLVWTGAANNQWDTTSFNWAVAGTATATNFHLGDLVIFNDSASVNDVTIPDSVVPGQVGVGVTISNVVKSYTFSGGTIAGTALTVKQGPGSLDFGSTGQGPLNIQAGTVTGSGTVGTTTVASNAVLNFSGSVNGGLTSTGMVTFSGTITGPVSIQGGWLDNSGTINTTAGQVLSFGTGIVITNEQSGVFNVGAGTTATPNMVLPNGSTIANFGNINLYQPRLLIDGLYFGDGTINDPNGGGLDSGSGATRLQISSDGTMGVGRSVSGSVSSMNVQMRFDFNADPTSTPFGFSTIWIDFDFANPQVNDVINCDRWNNDTGMLIFTNINPGAGTFHNGQVFTILNNTSGTGTNNHVDTVGYTPMIQPYVPGPGLIWGITNFNGFGTVSVTTNAMIWDGLASANWSTNAPDNSWKVGQAYTPNVGTFFGDNAGGSTVVNIATVVNPAGDKPALTDSNNAAVLPGIVVSNSVKDYVFVGVGKITGPTGLYKTGSGTLTLLTTNANDFSGNVVVDGGTLAVTNLPTGGNTIVSLGAAGGGQMKNSLFLDGGTLAYIGTTNVQLGSRGTVLNSDGGTVQVTSATNMFTLNNNVVGVGTLTKTGPGTLQLSGGNNRYSGGSIVSDGTLRLSGANAGFGDITLNNDSDLEFAGNFTLTNDLHMNGPALTLDTVGSATDILSGPWDGSGSVTFNNTNFFVFNGSLANFSGTLSFGATTANYRFNNSTNSNPVTGSTLATFDLGTGSSTLSNLNGATLTYDLGALSGGPNTVLAGRSGPSAAAPGTTYSIGANGANTTFAGKIVDGQDTVTVVKVGSGTLLLNGNNTYTGSTTVSNGVLGGTGSIAGALTVTANGTIAPGAPSGTFTVNNNATLNGTTLMQLSGSAGSQLSVSGTLTVSGALIVTNLGPDIPNNTVFHLFNKPVTGFTSEILPTNNPAHTGTYTWQDNLATDGTIKLLTGGSAGPNLNPTNITVSVSGNVMTLSWPSDYLGWQLQSNSVGLTASNFWFPVAGSTSTTQEQLPMDTTKTNVFFRMVYPPAP